MGEGNMKTIREAKREIEILKKYIRKETEKARLKKPHCDKCFSGFVYMTRTGLICRKCGNKKEIKTQ